MKNLRFRLLVIGFILLPFGSTATAAEYRFQHKLDGLKSAPVINWSINEGALPEAIEGQVYAIELSDQVSSSNGIPSLTWSVQSLPEWLSLDASGRLAGTPTSVGNYTFQPSVTDGERSAQPIFTLVVNGVEIHAVKMAAGYAFTCAVTTQGGVKCWGTNQSTGFLGNGTSTDSLIPVDVINLAGRVVDITSGGYHTCALIDTGQVQCWGRGMYGRLGDGSTSDRRSPVLVNGLSNAVAIEAGAEHTCAITADQKALCWGRNSDGKLGNGSTTNKYVPEPVIDESTGMPMVGLVGISAGTDHTCAVTGTGEAYCWGETTSGRLGTLDFSNPHYPTLVENLTDDPIKQISAGNVHTCGITVSGKAKCWGGNYSGNLGNGKSGSSTNQNRPVDVVGIAETLDSVTTLSNHNCAVAVSGNLYCWGENGWGQLGDGTTSNRSIPVQVSALSSAAAAVNVSQSHSCAVLDNGTSYCWGYNNVGQLGNGQSGTSLKSMIPVEVVFEP